MEHQWDDTDRGKEKNMSRGQFVYQKSHTNWIGVDPTTPQGQAGEWTRVVR
jgi:hypothetical protein